MVLTRDFKETIRERVNREPAFREALLTEGIECLLAGDMDTGRPCCATTSMPPSDFRNSAG